MELVGSAEIDREFCWPDGRALRLARRKKLPHIVLPDGEIRFDRAEIWSLLRRVEAEPQREAVTC